MFDTEPKYSTRVVSASQSTVLILSKDFLLKCFSKSPKIVTNYLEQLASKISFLNAKISSYTAKSAENKLLAYLMQLPRENNVVFLNTDFSSIAKMIEKQEQKNNKKDYFWFLGKKYDIVYTNSLFLNTLIVNYYEKFCANEESFKEKILKRLKQKNKGCPIWTAFAFAVWVSS